MPVCGDGYDDEMNPDKAPAYWPTRILLAVAIVATMITVAIALWPGLQPEPMFGRDHVSVLGLPSSVVGMLFPVGLALLGLAWEIRIFRGSRDAAPPWRYREH